MQTTTKDDYNKVLKTSIILCWVFLIVCFVVKIFGGSFFSIVVENEKFVKVCNFIDNKKPLFTILQFIIYYIGTYIYLCGTFRIIKTNFKQLLLFAISIGIIYLSKFINIYFGSIVEAILLIAIPIVCKRQKWYMSIVYFALTYLFAFISVVVRDIAGYILPDYFLIGAIMTIDYYIMMTLFMLHNYKKEIKNNG